MSMINTAFPAFLSEQNSTLACTVASSNVAVGARGDVFLISNEGAVTAYVAFGADSTVVVVAGGAVSASSDGGFAIGAGKTVMLRAESQVAFVAGITGSATATLRIARGTGLLN